MRPGTEPTPTPDPTPTPEPGTRYAFVAAGSEGLLAVDVSDPADLPQAPITVTVPGEANDVVVIERAGNKYALVAAGSPGLQVVDITDPRQHAGGRRVRHARQRVRHRS